jgi:hypothetical protein
MLEQPETGSAEEDEKADTGKKGTKGKKDEKKKGKGRTLVMPKDGCLWVSIASELVRHRC